MVKGYLKYIFLKQFGLLSNPNCCPVFDLSGKTIFTGSNEFVYQWNKCTSENLLSLAFPSSESNVDSHTVTCISIHPFECSTLAVGYQNGSIRLWNTETREILMTFDGHKSRITVLQFRSVYFNFICACTLYFLCSLDGHLLFSGATDTDIVCWDVTSRSGLFRLRGHTNQVTALRLLHKTIGVEEKDVDMSKDHRDETSPRIEERVKRRTKKNSMKEQLSECETPSSSKQDANFKYFTCNPLFLLSTSKDGTMKLWDLATHWCIQTVFDSSGEIWSLAVNSLEVHRLK
jgi:U3 small nucleolar RNA-associated protein 12